MTLHKAEGFGIWLECDGTRPIPEGDDVHCLTRTLVLPGNRGITWANLRTMGWRSLRVAGDDEAKPWTGSIVTDYCPACAT